VGIKAGISLANQDFQITSIDYTLKTDPVIGPAAGIFLEAFRVFLRCFLLFLAL